MKITKRQLRQLVKEARSNLLEYGSGSDGRSGSDGAYSDAVSASQEAYYDLEEVMNDWERGLLDVEEVKARIYVAIDKLPRF
jgi:hypothetical protein